MGGISVSRSASGLDVAAGAVYVYLVLIGGILALVGGIGMLATKAIGFLLPVGGILALVGGIWGLLDIGNAAIVAIAVPNMSVSIGDGIYASIIGAILALIGSLGLKGGG